MTNPFRFHRTGNILAITHFMGHKISAQDFIDLLYIQMAPTEKGQQSTLEC